MTPFDEIDLLLRHLTAHSSEHHGKGLGAIGPTKQIPRANMLLDLKPHIIRKFRQADDMMAMPPVNVSQ